MSRKTVSSVRPCVGASVCTPKTLAALTTFFAKNRFQNESFSETSAENGLWSILKRVSASKIRDFTAHFLFENRRCLTKMRDFAVHLLFGNRRFSTKMRDFAVHLLFENERFSAIIYEFPVHLLFEN